MSREFYEGLRNSLNEALEYTKGERKLRKTKVSIVPVKRYSADEIKRIRKSCNMSQSVFAGYLGVSNKTIEAWESGVNRPTGSACRLLSMLEQDTGLVTQYPFVSIG